MSVPFATTKAYIGTFKIHPDCHVYAYKHIHLTVLYFLYPTWKVEGTAFFLLSHSLFTYLFEERRQ